MERTSQRRVIDVGRGLFLVRYLTAEDAAEPPIVRISVEPASGENVNLIMHPDHDEAVLTQPGSCLVVSASLPSKLGVAVEPRQRNGSVAAKVNIEPLTQGPRVDNQKPPSSQPENQQSPSSPENIDIRVLGHIAGVGDVRVNANEWLAGPAAPSRIEGITIECPGKPSSLGIGYSVRTAQPHSISGRVMDVGSFAGTRGRAMPLTALLFELSGPEASRYQFVVEALFLGSPIMRVTGPRVVLSGPSGREPLVGLRLALAEIKANVEALPKRSSTRTRTSDRIRVFRSDAKRVQSAS